MKVKSNFMGNDTKIKANTIAMVDNNKGISLNEYLGNLSDLNTADKSSLVGAVNEVNQKTKIEDLLNTYVQAPNSADSINYGNLNKNYNNYDLLLVRIGASSTGGEGTWGIIKPGTYNSDRIYLYAMSTYYAHVIIQVQNDNQIGIRTIDSRGWALNGLYIAKVYGIKLS